MAAHIDAEDRIGAIRIRLQGQVPSDLVLYMSEIFQDVTKANATWIYKQPTSFTIFPKDQQRKTETLKQKNGNKFEHLYLLFESKKKTNNQQQF